MKARDLILPASLLAGVAALLSWGSSGSAEALPTTPEPRPIVPGGRLMSPFGPRRNAAGPSFHYGIDLAAARGAPVYSPIDGVVVAAYPDGEVPGYGNVLTLRRGTMGLLFAHLDSMDVRRGDRVVAGQLLGRVGSTNSAGGFETSGPHLHLEVIVPTPGEDVAAGLAHFTGSTPPRTDPAAWANEVGARLV